MYSLDIVITFLVDAVVGQMHTLIPDVPVALLISHCGKPVYHIQKMDLFIKNLQPIILNNGDYYSSKSIFMNICVS